MNRKLISIAFVAGYILMSVGAVLGIFGLKAAFYTFASGTLLNIVARIQLLPKSDDRRIRRLNTQQFFVVAGFIATSYFLYRGKSYWVVFLLMAVVVDFYLTFRYPKADSK